MRKMIETSVASNLKCTLQSILFIRYSITIIIILTTKNHVIKDIGGHIEYLWPQKMYGSLENLEHINRRLTKPWLIKPINL